MKELAWYPVSRRDKAYTIPDSVETLNAQLREMKYLKELTLNCNVKSTLEYIGMYSDSLESIIVPANADAKQTQKNIKPDTATTHYLYNRDYRKCFTQTTLVVKENLNDYEWDVDLFPTMRNIKKSY